MELTTTTDDYVNSYRGRGGKKRERKKGLSATTHTKGRTGDRLLAQGKGNEEKRDGPCRFLYSI